MARIDTLTAYKCKFRYMQRNNPLIEEQREKIKLGNDPSITFDDFIMLYSETSDEILIGKNSDRAIGLSKERISSRTLDNTKSWYISPIAGKQGQPMTVVKRSTGKRYDFGSDAAALYNYHLFVYENEDGIVAIFHRQNSSGCKSVFLETANNIHKEKGLKLEMDLIVPISDITKDVTPTKITLQYIEENASSDVADNLRNKKTIIRDVGLNLEAHDNSIVAGIIHNMQLGKIRRRTKNVSWNEFENIVGVHDISEELHSAYKRTNNFVGELTKLSDKYYNEIINSGVVDDE